MQSSIFNIFGEESRGLPLQQSARQSSSHILKGPGIENLRTKSNNVADYPSKNALGDIGNTQKKNKALQEKPRQSNDQENASSNLLMRTPLQKAKLSIQTPNVKPVVRSPLSDLLPKPRAKVPVFQEPSQKVQGKNSYLEEIPVDFINDNFVESSFWDLDDFSPKEEYTDILPKSVLRTDAEICKLVNFWEISKVPIDFESDEDVAVEDRSDLFRSASPFDIVLEEPFPVPVVLDDDF